MRITVKAAEKLARIVDDLYDNVVTLNDVVANLQDSDIPREDRDDDSNEAMSIFDELCSNVRVLAKALKVDADRGIRSAPRLEGSER